MGLLDSLSGAADAHVAPHCAPPGHRTEPTHPHSSTIISASVHPTAIPRDSRSESITSPIVAPQRLESRKALLDSDPGFYNAQYEQPASYGPIDEFGQPNHGNVDPAYAQQAYAQAYAPATFTDPAYAQPAYKQSGYSQPADPQASYTEPSYAENSHVDASYNQGYAHREGLAPAVAPPSTHGSKLAFLKSRWSAAFMAVSGIQAIVCLFFESYVFGKFQSSLGHWIDDEEVQSQYKTIPTFLTLFIFGFLYVLVVVWDALRLKNTIQVIGVCIAELALLVYTAIQVDQIQVAIEVLGASNALSEGITGDELWSDVKPYLVATPAVIALTTVCMAFISWKLYQVFAWDILKNIGADYRMKKRFLYYQIYIALLKFDFFFFLGFIIQFVVIVAQKNDPEFALTIATIPITIVILFAAAYFTRRESKIGQVIVIILYFGGLTYFIFKLVRIYQPGHKESYAAVRKSLTAFAVITILLIILTIVNAIICMRNFGSGLKAHLLAPRKVEEKPDANSIGMHDVKPQLPSRMTID